MICSSHSALGENMIFLLYVIYIKFLVRPRILRLCTSLVFTFFVIVLCVCVQDFNVILATDRKKWEFPSLMRIFCYIGISRI